MRVDVVLRGMSQPAMAQCVMAADVAAQPVTVWLPESPGDRHSFATAATLLARSRHVRVGTGVVPIPMRQPVDVLSAAMTLAEAFPGRFDLGVGSGNVASLGNAKIAVDGSPLVVARRFLDAYAGLGRRSGLAALIDLPGTVTPPPVYLAAHNRKMIEAAVRHADGVLLNVVPESDLPATIGYVRACAERAGTRPTVGMFQLAAFGLRDAVAAARRVLVGFLRSPVVRMRLSSFGSRHRDLAERVARLPAGIDDAALSAALPADVVEDFAVTSEDALRERLRAARAWDIDFVALSVFPAPLHLRRPFPPVPEEEAARLATVDTIRLIDTLARETVTSDLPR